MKRLLVVLIALMVSAASFAGGQQGSGTALIGLAMPETHVERWSEPQGRYGCQSQRCQGGQMEIFAIFRVFKKQKM
jgi:hypothetical protein